jgi:hypothetical protein
MDSAKLWGVTRSIGSGAFATGRCLLVLATGGAGSAERTKADSVKNDTSTYIDHQLTDQRR